MSHDSDDRRILYWRGTGGECDLLCTADHAKVFKQLVVVLESQLVKSDRGRGSISLPRMPRQKKNLHNDKHKKHCLNATNTTCHTKHFLQKIVNKRSGSSNFLIVWTDKSFNLLRRSSGLDSRSKLYCINTSLVRRFTIQFLRYKPCQTEENDAAKTCL